MGRGEQGDAGSLAASYAALFRELSAVFRARGLSSDEARDLAQESLVRTFVHLKRHGRTRPDLRPLAHTIARRLYVERGRRLRPTFVELPEAEDLPDPAPQPVEHVVAEEERRDVRVALRSLTPRHRRVIAMWMSGLRPPDIARELGIKRNAADALLHRARRQLAVRLSPQAALGLIPLLWLRVRSGLRGVADLASRLDPAGAQIAAASAFATVGLAALLLFGDAPRTHSVPAPEHVTHIHAQTLQLSAPAVDRTANTSRTAPASPVAGSSLEVQPPKHDIGLTAHTGQEGDDRVEAGIIFQDDGDSSPSTLGPVIEEQIEMLCGLKICEDSK